MAIEENKISEQIFKIMKSYGFSLKLYDKDGKKTVNPETATRFYSNTHHIMVNLDTSVSPARIKVNIGIAVDIKEIANLLKNLKNLARQRLLGYTLGTFGKKIYFKEFAYQSKLTTQTPSPVQVMEGFVKPVGSLRVSKHRFGETTLVVKHSEAVNEEIKGARSRHIQSVFIENRLGERFNFPHPSLAGARAMTVHIENGGNPYDEMGKHIVSICEELKQLRKFNRYGKRNLNEKYGRLLTEVANRINAISNTLKSLCSQRNYTKYVQETRFGDITEVEDGILKESGLDSLDAELASAMPFVGRLLQNIKNQLGYLKTIRELMTVLRNQKNFRVVNTLSADDPEHPDNLTFNDEVSRLSVFANYLSAKSEDNEAKNLLATIAEEIYSYGDDLIEIVSKLLTSLEKTAIVTEQSGNADGLLETHILEINKTINKYSFRNTFK